MKRRSLNLLTGLSLLLCFASGGLWASSYCSTIGWRFFSQDMTHSWTTDLETIKGGVQFRQDIRPPYSFIVAHGPRWNFKSHPAWTNQNVLGFGANSFTYPWATPTAPPSSARRIVVVAPLYPFFLLTALGAFLGIMAFRHRRSVDWLKEHGRCITCGYDLRETPERCPECGVAPNARTAVG
jgi:hypothetical protein